jgi:hypothetical protein
MSKMNTVGPTTSRNVSSRTASTMLPFDSHWTPRWTPDTAETTNMAVSTAMITTANPFETSTSQRKFIPLLICSAPRPSEVALPKSVAKIASPSMPRPIGPSTRSPSSGRNADEIRFGAPLRWTK